MAITDERTSHVREIRQNGLNNTARYIGAKTVAGNF